MATFLASVGTLSVLVVFSVFGIQSLNKHNSEYGNTARSSGSHSVSSTSTNNNTVLTKHSSDWRVVANPDLQKKGYYQIDIFYTGKDSIDTPSVSVNKQWTLSGGKFGVQDGKIFTLYDVSAKD
ncbi:hypothetical protein, partial [Alicyclobacillus acidiphilus]